MAEVRYKAFLSCSFAAEDKELAEFFKGLIDAFDIEPVVYDYQEIGRLPEKVKENIVACDCLIALATRREKIEGSGNWTYADWIQQEIVLANAYGKPIAIFIEDGVQISGVLSMEERREQFKRDDLIGNIDKIAKFLYNVRKYLETSQVDAQPTQSLTRHYVRVNAQMRSRDELVQSCEIFMESLVPNLEAVPHDLLLDDSTPGLSVKPSEFRFQCLESPSGVKVGYEIQQSTESRFFFLVTFDPPLKAGERVKYAYTEVLPNSRPYSMEELQERIRSETYKRTEPVVDAYAWNITHATYELRLHFEFPEGYEIVSNYPDVRAGKARLPALDELQRIKDGEMFIAEKVIDKWQFTLTVKKPLSEHTYYIFYVPPSSAIES
jgi:hypothetical protein